VKRASSAFTVLEVCIVVAIIAILATLMIPAQRFQCTANLRSLYISADLFVQQNGSWPQIPRTTSTSSEDYAKAWIDALTPFGAPAKTWICPTMQGLLDQPDYWNPENVRIDYIPMPFDDKPTSPHEWPRQPWFIETGDVHGNGNLIVYTDGSISDLTTVLQSATSGP
jgi:type II secretory pathway pseudopilin PulG